MSFFKDFLNNSEDVYIMAVDETVEGKSGKHSHGISRFYSSTRQQTIPAICFFGLGIVNVKKKVFSMFGVEQVVYDDEDRARITAAKEEKMAGVKRAKEGNSKAKGRPFGQKNKPREENITRQFVTFKSLFNNVLGILGKFEMSKVCNLLVADSAYGTLDYYEVAMAHGIDLLSKFKCNTALWLPYEGEQKSGRQRVYGEKLDMNAIPKHKLVKEEVKDGQKIEYYMFEAYAKNCFGPILLKVVVAKAKRLSDGKVGTNIWFTTKCSLGYETIIEYYSLRFQIEFDFRDAKQHFGLSSFKNYKKENLTNFVNLSFSLCLISKAILEKTRQEQGNHKIGILDLKLIYKARFTAKNILKLIRESSIPIFNDEFCKLYIPKELINVA